MFKNGGTITTQIGYINRNDQKIMGTRGLKGTDHFQYAYKVKCQRKGCDFEYGANGSDLFQRKCPKCQSGKPGINY